MPGLDVFCSLILNIFIVNDIIIMIITTIDKLDKIIDNTCVLI